MSAARRSKSYYEPARWYDLRDFSQLGDVPFFLEMASKCGPDVLECASGTGRIAIPLAQAGYHVVGLDRDEAMLRRCREKWRAAQAQARGTLRIVKADMTDFRLRRRFDLAFVAFNTFLTLARLEDREKMIRCVRRHLKPQGRLIIDVFQPSLPALASDQPERLDFEIEDPQTGCMVRRYSRARRDMSTQQLEMTFEYRWIDPEGQRHSEATTFPMCVIFPIEMRMLLEYNGFEVERVLGSHDGSPFEKNSPLMIVIARRSNRSVRRSA